MKKVIIKNKTMYLISKKEMQHIIKMKERKFDVVDILPFGVLVEFKNKK